VALIDVVPTLLDLLGDERGSDALQGQSLLVPALSPERLEPDRPIFCAVASQWNPPERFFRRSVRTSRFALLQDVLEGSVLLYDEHDDPQETRDVGADPGNVETRRALERFLSESRSGNLGDRLP